VAPGFSRHFTPPNHLRTYGNHLLKELVKTAYTMRHRLKFVKKPVPKRYVPWYTAATMHLPVTAKAKQSPFFPGP
jgi:hypothetical protein